MPATPSPTCSSPGTARTILAASDDTLTALDAGTGRVTATVALPGIADLSPGGTGPTLVATPSEVEDSAAVVARLVGILGGTQADFTARLAATPDPDGTGRPGPAGFRGGTHVARQRDRGERAPGRDGRRRVAGRGGDGRRRHVRRPDELGTISTIDLAGGAHGLAFAIGVDDPTLYVTTGTADDPSYETITSAATRPRPGRLDTGNHFRCPGLGSLVAWNDATQMVHILGRVPTVANGGDPARRTTGRSTSSSRTGARARERRLRGRQAAARHDAVGLGDGRRSRSTPSTTRSSSSCSASRA